MPLPWVFALPQGLRDDASIVPYRGLRRGGVHLPGWLWAFRWS